MASTHRLNRRSHIKSKAACLTCKRRHVRCDELRPLCRNCLRLSLACEYPEEPAITTVQSPTSAAENVLWTPLIRKEVEEWRSGQRLPSPLRSTAISSLTACTNLSYRDARIFYHIATLIGVLEETGGLTFAFGLCPMPEFIQLSLQHECAKAALLALSSHHLCMITRTTALDQLTYAYKQQACSRLSEAVGDFSEDNADAVLAASMMLGWATWEKAHYAKLLLGTSAVLDQMKARAFHSILDTIFGELAPLPTENRRVVVAYLTFPEPDLFEMKPLASGLEQLSLQEGLCSEVLVATRALLDFIRNVRLKQTTEPLQQAEVYSDVHAWTPWMPVSILGLGWRSLPVMTLMCYFHAVNIAAEAYLPSAIKAVFPRKRTEVIGSIYATLASLEPVEGDPKMTQKHINTALEHATVSMVYAVRQRIE